MVTRHKPRATVTVRAIVVVMMVGTAMAGDSSSLNTTSHSDNRHWWRKPGAGRRQGVQDSALCRLSNDTGAKAVRCHPPEVLSERRTQDDVEAAGDGEEEAGFDLLFQSNSAELHDTPIHFHPPLPPWLGGTLVRNGPGLFEHGDRRVTHVFDGLAKLTSWRFQPNSSTAFFSTRFLQSQVFQLSQQEHTIAPFLLLDDTDPPFSPWERAVALWRGLDNLNVNILRLPSFERTKKDVDKHDSEGTATAKKDESLEGAYDYVAIGDYWKAYSFSPRNLSTGSAFSWRPTSTERQGSRERGQKQPKWKLWKAVSAGWQILTESSWFSTMTSAHPLPEPGTPNHLTFLVSVPLYYFGRSRIQLIRLRSSVDSEVVATIDLDRLPYMHSFSITTTHALILAHPFYLDPLCLISGDTASTCLTWEAAEASRLFVVQLRNGRVTQLEMENVFVMHHINAFNVLSKEADSWRTVKDDRHNKTACKKAPSSSHRYENVLIILDMCAYANADLINHMRLCILRDPLARKTYIPDAQPRRYLVDLGAGTVSYLPLNVPSPPFPSFLEMPVLHEGFRARAYCFVYGLSWMADGASLASTAVVKRDVCGRGRDRYWLRLLHYPVEPVFVPRPLGVAEDDGVLLVPMIDGPRRQSYMAVLDAKDLSVVSTAYLPTLVPYSLHGQFFADLM